MPSYWYYECWAFIFEGVACHTQQLTLLSDPYSIDVLSKASLPVDGHAQLMPESWIIQITMLFSYVFFLLMWDNTE